MWYECQWDNSPSKSQFVKVNHYRSNEGLQHGALAHSEQQAIKGLTQTGFLHWHPLWICIFDNDWGLVFSI